MPGNGYGATTGTVARRGPEATGRGARAGRESGRQSKV